MSSSQAPSKLPTATPGVGPSIDDATLTFVRTIRESVTQPHPSQALALNAFSTAFQRWNPQTIYDMKLTDQATLDLLFATPPKARGSNVPICDHVFQSTIQNHQQVIGNLVQKFNQTLTAGILTLPELRAACTAIESPTWNSYKAYCNYKHFPAGYSRAHVIPLPSIRTITGEMKKLEQLKETIRQQTCVCIQGTIYSIGNYSFPTDGTNQYSRGITTTRVDVTEKFCTAELQKQLTNIQRTIGANPDFLYWYAYFKHHPSILLPSEQVHLPNVGSTGLIFDLDASCKTIKDAFGLTMSYTGVGTATELLSKAGDYDAEMKILLNCKILNISAMDVTNFRAVKFLHEISTPLQDFLESCVQNKYNVVELDASFDTFQAAVTEFYSSVSHDRQSCLDFLNLLYDTISTTEINGLDNTVVGSPYMTLLHRIKYLTLALPMQGLAPLNYVLDSSELRYHFMDMKWLTVDSDENNENERLQLFDEEYDTLVNILRGYDSIDELLIVDSLKPVVRMFSYLERHFNRPTVGELVSRLKNDQDIQTLLERTPRLQNDIYDIHDRIASIKDLFLTVCHPPAVAPEVVVSNANRRPAKKKSRKS